MKNLVIGITIGVYLSLLSTYLGEQKYSDAIRECVLEKGRNK